jgi:crotonobetainyl-CoA:carnitine CoA-transferase CaiB-like acyl-CoA transferase
MKAALDGVRVIDFTQMMLGPWSTQFLGDMGADVIKVERPGKGEWERSLPAMGEFLGGDSPFFLAMNRNKRSLTVNLKEERGKEIIRKLVQDADVVVENFRPGVMDRLGLGYEALKELNPSIIYAAGSGWGQDGPYVKRPGQDLLVQAMSGMAAQNGRGSEPPVPTAGSFIDASTALTLAFSVMVALFHRERTGEGQRVDASLFNTIIAMQCQELVAHMNLNKPWERSKAGIGAPWLSAPFGIYETQDGYMAISMNPLDVLGDLIDVDLNDYASDEASYMHRDKVRELVSARIKQNTTDHWLGLLGTKDLWCAKVQDFNDLINDPQVAHNDLIQEIDHPKAGRIKVIGVPVQFSGTPGTIRLAPPMVGEHTDAVLAEAGYSEAEIATFHAEGIV